MTSGSASKPGYVTGTAYLPGLEAYAEMLPHAVIGINSDEDFHKSTSRNRCLIANSNGPLLLSIPIKGGRGVRCKVKEVRIDNSEAWQNKHWRSIMSAYGRSAYFIYYEALFRPSFEQRFVYLIDFNMALMQASFSALGWKKELLYTSDSREIIAPSHPQLLPYRQVFENRIGFIPGLSIVDLIFNMGNESTGYLHALSI